MKLHQRTYSKRGINIFRITSAVLVLGVLVLVVTETAKYLYSARIPKSVSSKIEPSVDKLASVLGTAKTSLETFDVSNKKNQENTVSRENDFEEESSQEEIVQPLEVATKIAVLSDSHNDIDFLEKALTKAKESDVNYLVFLGDYTDWGEIANLQRSKAVMSNSGVDFVSLPGDHDLGETRDESNFLKVFGKTYGTLVTNGVKLMYFDNSKNYTKVSETAMSWFNKEVSDTDILFLSQPLMTDSMLRVMGIMDGVRDGVVFDQNRQLLTAIRNGKVRVIISGDLHQFTKFQDPEKPSLWHYTVGAVLKSQSLEKLNLQSPRFAVLTVFNDASYKIDDITID